MPSLELVPPVLPDGPSRLEAGPLSSPLKRARRHLATDRWAGTLAGTVGRSRPAFELQDLVRMYA